MHSSRLAFWSVHTWRLRQLWLTCGFVGGSRTQHGLTFAGAAVVSFKSAPMLAAVGGAVTCRISFCGRADADMRT
jgi:hypothetical protein